MSGIMHENVPWTFVVPSDGASPFLAPLLDAVSASASAAAAILVWTVDAPAPEFPATTVIRDTAVPKSITRWWLSAIEAAPTDVLIVCNDDVELLSPGYLSAFAAAFAGSGATMGVVPGAYLGISGWCFALDRSHGVLPDPSYLWHVSDHDLYHRSSRPPGRGVYAHPDPRIRHCKFRNAEKGEMRELVALDFKLSRSRSALGPG